MENAFIGTIMAVGYNYVPQGWLACNGQIVSLQQYQALYSLLGNKYGGSAAAHTFGIPDLRGYTVIGSGQSTNGTRTVPAVTLGTSVGANTLNLTTTGAAALTIGAANLPATPVSGPLAIGDLNATSTLHATTSGPGPTAPAPGASAPSAGAMLSSTGSGPTSAAIYYTNPTPATPLPAVPLSSASVQTAIGTGATSFTSATSGTSKPLPVVAAPISTPVSMTQPSLGLTYIICWNGSYPLNPN